MTQTEYNGMELGPIRPPSESESLLLRVSRNCPWNRCNFCGLYKGESYSVRDKAEVLSDIEQVSTLVQAFKEADLYPGPSGQRIIEAAAEEFRRQGSGFAYPLVRRWYRHNMESVFLQDANSLGVPAADLAEILTVLRSRFPEIKRITTYARSQTLAKLTVEELTLLRKAGLTRVHVGMESGSDQVLRLVRKGATKEMHIKGGRHAVDAGLELSEYIMPGLGGRELSENHALESADALSRINPHFIRLRSLAIPDTIPLAAMVSEGTFVPIGDVETARELKLFLEGLSGIESRVVSDHILNLLPDVEGQLPGDKEKMIAEVDWFLDLPPEDQLAYRVGRRMGFLRSRFDFEVAGMRQKIQAVVLRHGINPANADEMMAELMKQYI